MGKPTPSPEQQAIIDFVGANPTTSLMVRAYAGAAKTTTIEMAAQGIRTSPNLAVAFNKRIATELESRLPKNFECKTLNGLGHKAWCNVVGFGVKLDANKMFKLTKEIITADGTRDEDIFVEVLALAWRAKSKGLVPAGAPMGKKGLVPDEDYVWEDIAFEQGFELRPEAQFFARQVLLRSIKLAYNKEIDFDDQIYMSVLFGGVYPKYHTTIVDEAQDLSPLNHIQLVKATAKRLIAIGDPYQAIYAFRGADSNSMTNLMEHFEFKELGLTYSFRVPHKISARQNDHVPDFKSWETVNQGHIEFWPKSRNSLPGNDDAVTWSIADLPRDGFVLCRNNAPLMKLAFAMIKSHRPVTILGRDIGASLANLLNKICNKQDLPIEHVPQLIQIWYTKEAEKLKDSESKLDTLQDRRECLTVLVEASGKKTSVEAVNFIKQLFADKADGLVLSSGHRSKGLEKHWVMILDPWRCPSKQARKAKEQGNPGPMMQEMNLKYVMETRTKGTLVFANLEDCEEAGK